jgi:hypothetical protein
MRILKEENLGTMPNETEINMMFDCAKEQLIHSGAGV